MKASVTYLYFAVSLVAGSTAVNAQESDSATIEATADLRDAVATLTLSAQDQLRFGSISIPNGIDPQAQCVYTVEPISGSNGTITRTVAEVRNGDPAPISTGDPTPSGCSASGEYTPGFILVRCLPDTMVTFQPEIQGEGLPGLVFESGRADVLRLTNFNFLSSISAPGQYPRNVSCPNSLIGGFIQNPDPGGLVFEMSGKLTVSKDAQVGNVRVGTITLNATY